MLFRSQPPGTRWMSHGEEWALIGPHQDRYVDDLTGLPLPPELCQEARRKELEHFKSKGVWEIRTINEARIRMCRRPITVRWVETNMGDDDQPNIRSRLVAREIRTAGQDTIFAPTPPLESLRMSLCSASTTIGHDWVVDWDPHSDNRTQILMIDISRAYFNERTDENEPVYVQLPKEAGAKEGECALLRRHMYGTRRAAEGWQDEYSQRLREAGLFRASHHHVCSMTPWGV